MRDILVQFQYPLNRFSDAAELCAIGVAVGRGCLQPIERSSRSLRRRSAIRRFFSGSLAAISPPSSSSAAAMSSSSCDNLRGCRPRLRADVEGFYQVLAILVQEVH